MSPRLSVALSLVTIPLSYEWVILSFLSVINAQHPYDARKIGIERACLYRRASAMLRETEQEREREREVPGGVQ